MHIFNCQDLNFFFHCKSNIIKDSSIPEFYKKCHNWWVEVHSVPPKNAEMIKQEIIWNNRYITINNSVVLYKKWLRGGIIRIKDILDEDNLFISHTEIERKYGIKCNFLDVLQLRQSIPIEWRILLFNTVNSSKNKLTNFHVQIVDVMQDLNKLTCKHMYWTLVSKKSRKPTAIKKWSEYFTQFTNADESVWPRIYQMSFMVTRETRLQSFQYRILHRIIPCNKWLFDITI